MRDRQYTCYQKEDREAFAAYQKAHPNNLWSLSRLAQEAVEAERWEEVIRHAEALIRLVPEDAGSGSGYHLKAQALRKLERIEEEIGVLREIAERDPSAMAVFLRLIELDQQRQDWLQVQLQARRAIALNPFLRSPQQALAEAAEALQETVWMISAKYDTVARLLTKLRDATDTLLNGAVSYSVTVPPNPPDHPIEMEARQSAYLLYKEALHNVVKHAHAKHVNIVIAYEGSRLSISIEDDGRGFDPEKDDTGNGLGLMRERAARYDGSFRVASVLGRGTTVSFTLRIR